MSLYPKLAATVESISTIIIPPERRALLKDIINYITQKLAKGESIKLNFICTHNSRRSQLAQIWAQTAADYYELNIACFSGGVEVTAFNENAVEAIVQAGFEVSREGDENPVYLVGYTTSSEPIPVFSKLYDDIANPTKEFAAIMTCSDADENCPFIPGTDVRIPLLYDDPKEFDNTPLVAEKYTERSNQIAAEMFYIFSQLNAE